MTYSIVVQTADAEFDETGSHRNVLSSKGKNQQAYCQLLPLYRSTRGQRIRY
jgi:hypothetical protein